MTEPLSDYFSHSLRMITFYCDYFYFSFLSSVKQFLVIPFPLRTAE